MSIPQARVTVYVSSTDPADRSVITSRTLLRFEPTLVTDLFEQAIIEENETVLAQRVQKRLKQSNTSSTREEEVRIAIGDVFTKMNVDVSEWAIKMEDESTGYNPFSECIVGAFRD